MPLRAKFRAATKELNTTGSVRILSRVSFVIRTSPPVASPQPYLCQMTERAMDCLLACRRLHFLLSFFSPFLADFSFFSSCL